MPGAADISAGRAFVSLYVKTSEFAHGLVAAETRLRTFAEGMGTLGHILAEFTPGNIIRRMTDSFARLGDAISKTLQSAGDGLQSLGVKAAVAGVGIGGALLAAVNQVGHFGDAIQVMSQRTGASTEFLSEVGFAARQTGASMDDLETGVRMMQKTIGTAAGGSTEAIASLGTLGIKIEDIVNKSPEQQFDMIADGLAGIQDPALRATAAMDILGRGGTALLPILNNGSAGLRDFRMEAAKLGLTITPAQAKLAELLVDKFAALKEVSFAAVFSAVEALGPALLDAIKVATDLAVQFRSWVIDNQETVRLIGKVAIGLVAAGAGAFAIGAALKGAGAAVGILTGAFSIFGHMVAAILPIVSLIGIAISIIGTGPILAVVGAIGSAIAASGVLGAAMSLLGTIATVVLPEVVLIVAAIAAGFAAVTAVVVGVVAAAGVAAVAFWKLTDPIASLLPVARAAFDALSKIGKALFSGDLQGAANAVIDGVKRVFLLGTSAILTMMQNAMQRLPGLIMSVLSGTGAAAGGIADTIRRAFTEIWPAVKLSFAAFLSFAGDVLDQLPAIAGYAAGRLIRAFFVAIWELHAWAGRAFVSLAGTILQAFANFGPKLIKAMITGNVGGLIKEIGMALAAGGGLMAGLANGAAPGFSPSGETIAAWQKLGDAAGKAQTEIVGVSGEGGPVGSGGVATTTTPIVADSKTKTAFDHTPIEKYKTALDALKADKLTPEEFARGLAQLRKETLGIDAAPLDQFRDRAKMLTIALHDGVISVDDWRREMKSARESILQIEPGPIATFSQRVDLLYEAMRRQAISSQQFGEEINRVRESILGLKPEPIDAFAQRMALLNVALQKGTITQAEWSREFKRGQQEILGIQQKPIEAFSERVQMLNAMLARGAISSSQWKDEFKRAKQEILGVDVGPLQKFADTIKDLQDKMSALTPAEFSAGFKKAKDEFLGFDSAPLETFKARMIELRSLFGKGLITTDQFNQAALNALPDKARAIIDETRTPLEKYRKEMADLEKLKGVLSPETFQRKQRLLAQELPSQQGFVGFSAAAAVESSRGGSGGSPQERLLKEATEARKQREKQLEEARLARRALDKMANGMAMK